MFAALLGIDIKPICLIVVLSIYASSGMADASSEQDVLTVVFNIPAGSVVDALDNFGEQSGLQIIYAYGTPVEAQSSGLRGDLTPSAALNRLLEQSNLAWEFVNGNTVLVSAPPVATLSPLIHPIPELRHSENILVLHNLRVNSDPRRVLPNELSGSAFGFDKSILETPRSISVISEESIELFGLSGVEDLTPFVPGVFTTTRFGIQGAIDVRGVPADTYVRGMKRLNLQGHGRTVLGAMDSIEVVRGPSSPIYGMGKIGGYTNVVPKSGRARMGGYLAEPQGYVQGVTGSYNRAEVSFGVGGALSLNSEARRGGYYLYGLLEDSDSFTEQVGIGQKLLQVAISVENLLGPVRAEAGIHFQRSNTSGALLNRVTQNLIDRNIYIQGQPLAHLDLNGNGKIGFLEMHEASPVRGRLSSDNQPLIQRWDWPTDDAGNFLPINQFPVVPGIPESLYEYLSNHPEADPDGLLRAQGVGGPLPRSGYVPVGFALDPRTIGYSQMNLRRAGAFEHKVQADFGLAFFDLIYDLDHDFTFKNQLFFDSMDQYKLSGQPSGGKQDVEVIENKTTFTKRIYPPMHWLGINTLGSINVRTTHATGRRYTGDQGSHRTDSMWGAGLMTPNTTFVHAFENNDLEADGAPWFSNYRSSYWETGVGLLLDVDLWRNTNLMLGGRIDRSRAKNVEYSGTVNPFLGTSDEPGRTRLDDEKARAYDSGSSRSLSVSHRLPFNLVPYAIWANSSLTLESNNNRMAAEVIKNGHIGQARIEEFGMKANWLSDRLFLTIANYDQRRLDVSELDDASIQSAAASATRTKGWEAELKFAPLANMYIAMYGLQQITTFKPNYGASVLVDARTLGYQDVIDNRGEVVYPAEAFLYGGRAWLMLPPGMEAYDTKQGNPEVQAGINAIYQWNNGLGFTFSGNHFSSVSSGRLQLVTMPSAQVLNVGVFIEREKWRLKADVNNIADARYFRARTGDNLGETLIEAMPGRTWQVTLRVNL